MGVQSPNPDILAPNDNALMKRALLLKAEKIDLEKLHKIKANKIDLYNSIELFQNIHK